MEIPRVIIISLNLSLEVFDKKKKKNCNTVLFSLHFLNI